MQGLGQVRGFLLHSGTTEAGQVVRVMNQSQKRVEKWVAPIVYAAAKPPGLLLP